MATRMAAVRPFPGNVADNSGDRSVGRGGDEEEIAADFARGQIHGVDRKPGVACDALCSSSCCTVLAACSSAA